MRPIERRKIARLTRFHITSMPRSRGVWVMAAGLLITPVAWGWDYDDPRVEQIQVLPGRVESGSLDAVNGSQLHEVASRIDVVAGDVAWGKRKTAEAVESAEIAQQTADKAIDAAVTVGRNTQILQDVMYERVGAVRDTAQRAQEQALDVAIKLDGVSDTAGQATNLAGQVDEKLDQTAQSVAKVAGQVAETQQAVAAVDQRTAGLPLTPHPRQRPR